MTYNLLNYSGGRTAEFRTVLTGTQPDVLVAEEITGDESSVDLFLGDVLDAVNPGEWVAGPYTNGPDTDAAIFYRAAKCTLLAHTTIATALRDIDEWTIRPASHQDPSTAIRLYAVHLKASQGSAEEQLRLAEVTLLRDRMETYPAGGHYAVLGDFNIYTATEPAFVYMTSPAHGAAGVVSDPIGRVGNWHVNEDYADIHTQSPRVTQFGGGANGGMDDRFDMILAAPALLDGESIDLLPATYTAFGQDGQHFDGALNVPPFTVVTQPVAQALHDASDHLPVFADFQLPALLLADAALDVGAAIVGGVVDAPFDVGNAAAPPADELDYSFAAPPLFDAPAGTFQAPPGAGAATHSIGMDTGSPGARAGTLTITTDDPDRTSWDVALTGTVLDHAQPSADGATLLLVAPLDLGTVAAPDTAAASARVYDLGFGPLRSELEVWDAELTGDPGFLLDGGFTPAVAGTTPATFGVRFPAQGAALGLHVGTLVLRTRDLPGPPGAVDLDDVQFDLAVNVVDGTVAAGLPAAIARTGFVTLRPNPFRSVSEVRFGLARAARARVSVVDVAGRAVRTLVDAALPAGEHAAAWDGRDASGGEAAPGVYFVRLTADGTAETRKVTRLR